MLAIDKKILIRLILTMALSFLATFGGWFTATMNDSNFLKVHNAFTSRRLSDNTLMTPKIRVAPSCASSPGGTPGGGLPVRRHSSIGPQERRGSNINLSPPTVTQYFLSFRLVELAKYNNKYR